MPLLLNALKGERTASALRYSQSEISEFKSVLPTLLIKA
jgi:hypothetical protein